MTSMRKIFVISILISIIFSSSLQAQKETPEEQDTSRQRLIDYWKIGETWEYQVTTWGRDMGYSRCELVGIVDHASLGRALLFKSEAVSKDLAGNATTHIQGELFTQGLGYPGFYIGQYFEGNNKQRTMQGRIAQDGFKFLETIGDYSTEIEVNAPPWAFIVDKNTVPHWNLVFFNEQDFEQDTLQYSILIPYLKRRVVMTFTRQPDKEIPVMGENVKCHVFYSLRTDEYYYITPEKRVARVEIPDQALQFNLVSITKKEKPAEKQ